MTLNMVAGARRAGRSISQTADRHTARDWSKTRAGGRRMGGLVGEGHILNNSNGISECLIHPTLKQCIVYMHSLDFICDPVLERAT